jgi:hypothetical protein
LRAGQEYRAVFVNNDGNVLKERPCQSGDGVFVQMGMDNVDLMFPADTKDVRQFAGVVIAPAVEQNIFLDIDLGVGASQGIDKMLEPPGVAVFGDLPEDDLGTAEAKRANNM